MRIFAFVKLCVFTFMVHFVFTSMAYLQTYGFIPAVSGLAAIVIANLIFFKAIRKTKYAGRRGISEWLFKLRSSGINRKHGAGRNTYDCRFYVGNKLEDIWHDKLEKKLPISIKYSVPIIISIVCFRLSFGFLDNVINALILATIFVLLLSILISNMITLFYFSDLNKEEPSGFPMKSLKKAYAQAEYARYRILHPPGSSTSFGDWKEDIRRGRESAREYNRKIALCNDGDFSNCTCELCRERYPNAIIKMREDARQKAYERDEQEQRARDRDSGSSSDDVWHRCPHGNSMGNCLLCHD